MCGDAIAQKLPPLNFVRTRLQVANIFFSPLTAFFPYLADSECYGGDGSLLMQLVESRMGHWSCALFCDLCAEHDFSNVFVTRRPFLAADLYPLDHLDQVTGGGLINMGVFTNITTQVRPHSIERTSNKYELVCV